MDRALRVALMEAGLRGEPAEIGRRMLRAKARDAALRRRQFAQVEAWKDGREQPRSWRAHERRNCSCSRCRAERTFLDARTGEPVRLARRPRLPTWAPVDVERARAEGRAVMVAELLPAQYDAAGRDVDRGEAEFFDVCQGGWSWAPAVRWVRGCP